MLVVPFDRQSNFLLEIRLVFWDCDQLQELFQSSMESFHHCNAATGAHRSESRQDAVGVAPDEVKASTGSDCVIELGATELETSQQHARTNRYRILFICNVLDAERRRIFVLPNPFSKRGRGLFETTGTGIKFRFNMK